MEATSRSSRRRTALSLGTTLLLLCSCVGIKPAATQAVPPADHESILHALRYAGLSATAGALDGAIWNKGFMVPPSATLLVPTNAAMKPLLASAATAEDLVDVISYHIVAQNFPLAVLTSLPVGTRIPTLLGNTTLLVTDNDPSGFRINNRELMPLDLCTIQTVACYAVDAVLDSAASGQNDIISASPPIPGVLPPVEAPILPPPGLPLPPVGAPVVPPPVPVGAPVVPPVLSPLGPAVPAGAPALPPPGSPGGAPVPPGAPGTPGAPGASPPGTAPGGVPSAAVISSTSSMAVVVAALMVTFFFV